jgi:hypothetical protein
VTVRVWVFAAIAMGVLPGWGCRCSAQESGPAVTTAQGGALREVVFHGMCDASAAVPLSGTVFMVADDEDNVLRAYDAERGGPPLWSVDVSAAIGIGPKPNKPGKKPKRAPEADLEGATRVGDLGFWMSSHGRNSSGKLKRERLRLFATRLPAEGDAAAGDAAVSVVGRAYEGLLDDLVAEPRLGAFDLAAAAELAPKDPGGFNLEGMTARPDGGVWLGFRNPIPGGLALLIPLLNPDALVNGAPARFGDPVRLDLGGLGVRALSELDGEIIIAAGSYESGGVARLYRWREGQAPVPVTALTFHDFNPEGVFSPVGRRDFLLISDDGSRQIEGSDCKALKDPSKKRFRAVWVPEGTFRGVAP